MRDIVEYYYMWKTTSRYADLQKAKRAEKGFIFTIKVEYGHITH
jgi:hypothetical protein